MGHSIQTVSPPHKQEEIQRQTPQNGDESKFASGYNTNVSLSESYHDFPSLQWPMLDHESKRESTEKNNIQNSPQFSALFQPDVAQVEVSAKLKREPDLTGCTQ